MLLVNSLAVDELIEKYKQEINKLQKENEELKNDIKKLKSYCISPIDRTNISTSLYMQKKYDEYSNLIGRKNNGQ